MQWSLCFLFSFLNLLATVLSQTHIASALLPTLQGISLGYINLDIKDEEIDVRKQSRSQREFMLHKMFPTEAPNSAVAYQIVSYREKTIIHG